MDAVHSTAGTVIFVLFKTNKKSKDARLNCGKRKGRISFDTGSISRTVLSLEWARTLGGGRGGMGGGNELIEKAQDPGFY